MLKHALGFATLAIAAFLFLGLLFLACATRAASERRLRMLCAAAAALGVVIVAMLTGAGLELLS